MRIFLLFQVVDELLSFSIFLLFILFFMFDTIIYILRGLILPLVNISETDPGAYSQYCLIKRSNFAPKFT